MALAAAVFIALTGLWGHDAAGHASPAGTLPSDAESARAEQFMTRQLAARTPDLILLARADQPVDDPRTATAGLRLVRRLSADPAVARVHAYWPTRAPELRSVDGHGALIVAFFRGDGRQATQIAERVAARMTGQAGPLHVTATGEAVVRAAVSRQASADARRNELLALPVTLALLLLAFGSAVAAALPVLVGVFAVLGTLAVLRTLSEITEVSVYAVNVSAALAFGLAIDYSLFLLARYREERARGADSDLALRIMLSTAGRAVAASAATVALAMAALLLFPHPVLRSTAYGGITVTIMAATGSLLLLPAAVAILTSHLDRFDLFARWRHRTGIALATKGSVLPLGWWGRIAAATMRRPLWVGVPAAAVLLLLAAPFGQAAFSLADDRVLPAGTPAARATATLRADFQAATVATATTVVLPGFDARTRAQELDRYARRIAALSGVTRVDTATGTYRSRSAAALPSAHQFTSARGTYLRVATGGDPQDPANADRAQRIRALPAPVPALVGGPGAEIADVRALLADRLPLALALIATVMFALIFALTRCPVLALKALVLNTLSLCATFGAIVYVFQQGHLRWLVGDFTVTATTDVFLPILVFCIAFGLSMDYEIILLTRILEEHQRTGDTTHAVTYGLDRTATQFTWASLIVAVIMTALATSGLTFLKLVGVGLALAALLDATVVRGLLVPAIMALAGRANWWAPHWARPRPHLPEPRSPHVAQEGCEAEGQDRR